MRNDALGRLSLTALAARIGGGEITATEATEASLRALAGEGMRLGAVAGLDREAALAAAAEADGALLSRGRRGPLHGVPLAHKDMFFREGRLTECGSRLLAGHRGSVTATALARLDAAGAIDVARLTMSEFAIGPTGHNPVTGTPRNPWNEDHLAGGTSSGPAVAVAAGLVPGALASDTGGSARLPAAFCGVVGLKPSTDRVSRHGMFPVSSTLDHVGILARTVADAGLVLAAVAGPDPLDPTTWSAERAGPEAPPAAGDLAGLAIGVPRSYFLDDLDPAVERATEEAIAAFRALGARIVPVDVPKAELGNPMASLIIMVEAATVHRRFMAERPDDYAPETLARLRTGPLYAATDYRLALVARAELLRLIGEAVFDKADLLLTPSATGTAPRIDGADLAPGKNFADLVGPIGRCLRLFNVTGLPAISLPAGLAPNGLPVAIQLVARPLDEATLLRAGAAYVAGVGGFPAPPLPKMSRTRRKR